MPEVILLESDCFEDRRGFFMEVYKRSEFSALGIPYLFVQDNYSHSVRGVLRGLHFQRAPMAQGKLISVLRGTIFDVAVDIRRKSRTFGHWTSVDISAENRQLLYVPEGFAHGFCVLSAEADVLYKATTEYAPELETGIVWNDPDVGIAWPVLESGPILSDKDARLPTLRELSDTLRDADKE
jgi:dTDP-4-dehydrorhamnose 3,5-epimerase